MKIDPSKLKNVATQSDSSIRSQCPACAASGGDKKGEHLKLWPNGRFHCIVDNSKEHNRQILALAGSTRDEVVRFKIRPLKIEDSIVISLVSDLKTETEGAVAKTNDSIAINGEEDHSMRNTQSPDLPDDWMI